MGAGGVRRARAVRRGAARFNNEALGVRVMRRHLYHWHVEKI